MRFCDLILGMKDWDLKDELENKEVISINRVQQSQVINNSSSLIGILNLDILKRICLGLHSKFSEKNDMVDMISWLLGFYILKIEMYSLVSPSLKMIFLR